MNQEPTRPSSEPDEVVLAAPAQLEAASAPPAPLDVEVAKVLLRARTGTIDDLRARGDEGSAQWTPAHSPPATLLLHDLALGALPQRFGTDPAFAHVTALDLSGNRLTALPARFCESLRALRVLHLGGPPGDPSRNRLTTLPDLQPLAHLEDLALHDNALRALPELAPLQALRMLRLDRNPLGGLPPLPAALQTLHLEGCPLGGTLEAPEGLPAEVRALTGLDDLQLPDGSHVGAFFGTPLAELLADRRKAVEAKPPHTQTDLGCS